MAKLKSKSAPAEMEVSAILTANPNGVIAQKDIPEIYRIYKEIIAEHGGIDHKTLHAASKKRGNEVLAKYYTKDIKKAAEKCWQQESYKIIASVHYYIKEVVNAKPTKLLVRVINEDEMPKYVLAPKLLSHQDKMEELMEKAREELRLWEEKYRNLVTYADWFRTMHARVTKIIFEKNGKLVEDPVDDKL